MDPVRFEPLDAHTAPPASRPLLATTQANFGFVPSPVAKAARSPALLKQLLAGLTAFDQCSQSLQEREVVAMTMAFENDCHYCMALHSARLADDPANAPLLAQLRAGVPLTDARLDALRLFVLAVTRLRGRVDADSWQRLSEGGFGREQALDALQGIAAYWLSTVGNVLMDAELDAPFAAFAWQKPSPR